MNRLIVAVLMNISNLTEDNKINKDVKPLKL